MSDAHDLRTVVENTHLVFRDICLAFDGQIFKNRHWHDRLNLSWE